MFEADVPPPVDVHDAVYRALDTVRSVRAQVTAIQGRATRGPYDPVDLVGALEAIRVSLDRLHGQLRFVDEIAGGSGEDVVLDIRPGSPAAGRGSGPEP